MNETDEKKNEIKAKSQIKLNQFAKCIFEKICHKK
jgi:hypothetical protein